MRCYTVRPLHTDSGETYHQIVRIADAGHWTVIETHARRATADVSCRRLNAWARRRAEIDAASGRAEPDPSKGLPTRALTRRAGATLVAAVRAELRQPCRHGVPRDQPCRACAEEIPF